jgi:hypothetical protein
MEKQQQSRHTQDTIHPHGHVTHSATHAGTCCNCTDPPQIATYTSQVQCAGDTPRLHPTLHSHRHRIHNCRRDAAYACRVLSGAGLWLYAARTLGESLALASFEYQSNSRRIPVEPVELNALELRFSWNTDNDATILFVPLNVNNNNYNNKCVRLVGM